MIRLWKEIDGLVSSNFGLIKASIAIIKLEARLAAVSVYPLLLNVLMLFLVLTTIWLSAMLMLGYVTTLASASVILGLSSILLLNVGLYFGLIKYLEFNLKKMSFEKTRALIFEKGVGNHDQHEATVDFRHCSDGKNIKIPTNESSSA